MPVPSTPSVGPLPHVVGRYALYGEIASGGMATVHYGRLLGPVGFSRTVAIKRLHKQFAKDPEFASMFLDEARLAARIRHPNVVPTLDVVALEGELFLVMDYVQGESLGRLIRASVAKKQPIPLEIVSAIVCSVLHGLHAAHEATNEQGEPLNIVHRDVSPQNVLVGADGVPRVLDFGVAKAAGRMQTTREGQLKGKIAYMSPEQLRSGVVDRRTDVYAAGVVLWEALTLKHLFTAESEGALVTKVLEAPVVAPGSIVPGVPVAVDSLALRAVARDPITRFESARDMALALEAAVPIASPTRVTQWVEGLVGELLAERAKSVAMVESDSHTGLTPAGNRDGEAGRTVTIPEGMRDKALSAPRLSSPPSQVSSISVSTSERQPPVAPKPPARWAVAALAAAGLAAAAVAGFSMRGLRSNAPSAAAVMAPERAAQEIPAPPLATPLPSTALPAGVAPVPSPPPAPAPGDRPVSGGRRMRSPVSSQSVPPSAASSGVSSGAAPCTITSYLDESGIKHFVKECK